MFKLEYKIETEEIPIDDKKTQKIEVLQIEAHTDYPNTPINIKLDDGSAFGTQTDKDGIGRCGTSTIQDYHVTVEINDETFEDDIIIENEE